MCNSRRIRSPLHTHTHTPIFHLSSLLSSVIAPLNVQDEGGNVIDPSHLFVNGWTNQIFGFSWMRNLSLWLVTLGDFQFKWEIYISFFFKGRRKNNQNPKGKCRCCCCCCLVIHARRAPAPRVPLANQLTRTELFVVWRNVSICIRQETYRAVG